MAALAALGCAEAFLAARATVDAGWGVAPGGGQPKGLGPQTHLANGRSNPSWAHEVAGHAIQVRSATLCHSLGALSYGSFWRCGAATVF